MKPIEPDDQAYAYLEVFKDMTLEDIAEGEIEYIAVNLRNVLYEHPRHIKKLIKNYAKEYGVAIKWNTKKGDFGSSIGDFSSFKNGYLILFQDTELNEANWKLL